MNIFLACPHGALRGSEKIFVSGGQCEDLFGWSQLGSKGIKTDVPVRWPAFKNIFLFGPSGALTGSAKIFLSGGLREHHFNVPYPYCKY